MEASRGDSRVPGYIGLFSSMSTLVCCALPSLFVLFGFGAAVASVLSEAPWLVALSRNKELTFTVAGLVMATNFFYVYRVVPRLLVRQGTCPADDPGACARATRVSRRMLWFSAAVLVVGFSVAFILPIILEVRDA